MRNKRKDRALSELYDLTHRLCEPEITPVLKGSFRIQGPTDESDHLKKGSLEPSAKKDGELCVSAKSGTCNVCAAPCTSCMHLNQTVSVVESKIDDERCGEICKGKESKYCSSSNVDAVPHSTSIAREQQHTSSEASNLLSVSSSHDSFSENAQSKATMKTSEYVEMHVKVSGRTKTSDKLLSRQCNAVEQSTLECHDDNISCVIGVKDAKVVVNDHNVDSERKSIPCSSASACSSLVESVEKVVQHHSVPDCVIDSHCEPLERQCGSGRPSTCRDSSLFIQNSANESKTACLPHGSDPSEPTSDDVSVINSTPKLQPPHSRSQSRNSFHDHGDSKGSEGNSSSQCHERPSAGCSVEHMKPALALPVTMSSVDMDKIDTNNSGDTLLNNEGSKVSLIRNNSSSETPIMSYPFLETNVTMGTSNLSGTPYVPSHSNQQLENPNVPVEPVETNNCPLQQQLGSQIENSASAVLEDDVKVCDICGDTGREEMLAFCSRCSDGAEHTYCMRVMFDKVPESDWLCEECQIKEDADKQKQKKTVILETSKASQSNENVLVLKSDNKPEEREPNQPIKASASPNVSTMHPEDVELALNNADETETRIGPPGTTNSSGKALLSREISFKASSVREVKSSHRVPLSGSCSANSSLENVPSPASGPSSLMKEEHKSNRGSLSRSFTFNCSKPKVKLITEDVYQKQKLARGSANISTSKDGSTRTFSKSLSLNSVGKGLPNTIESNSKLQLPRTFSENSRGLKREKDHENLDRKKFRSDYPVCNTPSVGTKTAFASGAQKDGRSIALSKSIDSVAGKGSENVTAPGGSGVKKPFGDMWNSDEQKPCQVSLRKDTVASSGVVAELRRHQDSMNSCGKKKSSSLTCRKKNVSSEGIKSSICSEIGHVAQSCKASFSIEASVSSCVGEMVSKIKEKQGVVASAMSSGSLLKCKKSPDQFDETELKADMPTNMHIKASTPGTHSSLVIPEHDFIWRGDFEVQRNCTGVSESCEGIQAHLSTCASPKVHEILNKFSQKVQLEEVPRCSVWPMQFQDNWVTEDNIALYFFAKDLESYERNYKKLVENMVKNDLALRGNFDGIEILIFTSNFLPKKSQHWNRLFFLWAVFRERRIKCSAAFSSAQKKLYGDTDDEEPLLKRRCTFVNTEVAQRAMDSELSHSEVLPNDQSAGSGLMSDLPSTSSLSRTMISGYFCSELKMSTSSVKDAFGDPSKGKVTEFQPCNQGVYARSGFNSAIKMSFEISGVGQGCFYSKLLDRQDNSIDTSKIYPVSSRTFLEANISCHGEETNLENTPRLLDCNSSLERNIQVEPMATEQSNWWLSSSRCVNSADQSSNFSAESLSKAPPKLEYQDNEHGNLVTEQNKYRKMKAIIDENYLEQCVEDRFFPEKDICINANRQETAERCFFPVELDHTRDVSWNDSMVPGSESPDLSFSLGPGKNSKQVIPLFCKLEDERSSQDTVIDRTASEDTAKDFLSLTLSLALPFS